LNFFLKTLLALILVAVLLLVVMMIFFCIKEEPSAETTLRDMHVTVLEAGLTLKNLREATQAWRDSSDAQIKASKELLARGNKSLTSLDVMIKNTDKNLNQLLLPEIAGAVERQDKSLLLIEDRLSVSVAEMTRATIALEKTLSDADKIVTDPKITEASMQLAEASKELTASLEETHKAVTDVRLIADKARETYLKPVNIWWAVVKELLPLAGSAAQVIK
jgi:uncharacterized protein